MKISFTKELKNIKHAWMNLTKTYIRPLQSYLKNFGDRSQRRLKQIEIYTMLMDSKTQYFYINYPRNYY